MKKKLVSAQVKSSDLFLHHLNSPGIQRSKFKELKKSRDHTENMLKFVGPAKIKVKKFKNYNLYMPLKVKKILKLLI